MEEKDDRKRDKEGRKVEAGKGRESKGMRRDGDELERGRVKEDKWE